MTMKSRFFSTSAARVAAVAVFCTLLLCPMDSFGAGKKKNNGTPDFAFPQTVKKNADAELRKASVAGNWATAASAAVKLVTADNLVSRDNVSSGLQLVDSISAVAPEKWKPAFLLIQAQIYNSIYNSIRWQADSRKLDVDSVPANPFEWSRDIFADKVYSLCSKALDCREINTTPLKEWSPFLSQSGEAVSFAMTAKEFVELQSFVLLNVFCDETKDIIPFFNNVSVPSTPAQRCMQLRDRAIDSLAADAELSGQSILLAKALADKADCLAPAMRMKSLLSALDRVKDSEGSQLILSKLRQYVKGGYRYNSYSVFAFDKDEYVAMLRKSINQFPKGRYVNELKNIVADMTAPYAKIDLKNQYLSTDSIVANVRLANCNTAYFLIYDYSPFVNAENQPKSSVLAAKCRLVKTVKAKADGSVPFEADVKAEVGSLPLGVYVAIPSASPDRSGIFPTVSDDRWREPFVVSDISVMSLQYPDGSTRVFVVDGTNGAPIEGATVKVFSQPNYREKSRLVHTLATDKEGSVTVKENRFEIHASYAGSKWESDSRLYNSVLRKDTSSVVMARVLAERAICHPGDSVSAAVVVFSRKNGAFRLNVDKDYSVKLLDANGREVESRSLTTDGFGRAVAGFRIPDHGLLGRWRLAVTSKDGNYLGDSYIRVEDYVAPTFFITAELDSAGVNPGDSVRISGQVMTYSGMPLPGAEVKYNVVYDPPMWWFRTSSASYDSSVVSSGDGKFSIVLPTANLKDTKFEKGVFKVSLSATSAAGETQQGPVERFAVGRKYCISLPDSDDSLEASADEQSVTVNVLDMLGRKVNKTIDYSLVDVASGKTVDKGAFESPRLALQVKSLASAKYRLDLVLSGDSTVKASTDLVIWRNSDKAAPAGTGLWIPRSNVKAVPGTDRVQVTIGNGYGNRWMPVVESGNDSILSFRWVHVDKDNVTIEFDAPSGNREYRLNVNALSNLKNESAFVTLEPAASNRLDVKTVSFRDRISAGDREKWSFRFSKDSLPARSIPALAVMTDAALNAVTPFKWSFAPADGLDSRLFSMRLSPARNISQTYDFKRIKYLPTAFIMMPEINTYGRDWGLGYGMHDMVFVREPAYATIGSSEQLASVKRTSRAMNKSMALSDVVNEAKEEGVEYEEAEDAVSGDTGAGAAQEQEVALRDAECPVAFFMPWLNADADGVVTVDFTVPNFNTTWAFQLIGYDEQLATAKVDLEAVASKPVMVSAHSPRFVRTGDEIMLTATLFNNSGAVAPVAGRIELVDLVKGTVVAKKVFDGVEMEDAGSRVIEMAWTVPADLSAVGFRAYAESGSHQDGEQVLLPVLPASSPVVESTPFWIAPGADSFSARLPKFKDSDRVTLQYCDNPAWYCLTALPDIVYPDSKNVTAKMSALYGNAQAFSLVSSNSSLKSGLESMLSDSNSEFAALKSSLQKDGNLKITDLDNTPWVNDAASETLRMSRLSSLLNDTLASSTIGKLLDDIRGLQTPEGGWSWCPDMQPSQYITQEVLRYFGMLMKSGAMKCVPNADDMIKSAVEFVDTETVKDYRKYHKKGESLSYLLDWLYVRSMFPDSYLKGKYSREMSNIASSAFGDISRDWKSWSVGEKSKAALLLWRAGRQKAASEILESLRQYASVSEVKGTWFDNLSSGWNGYSAILNTTLALEAFSEIQPKNSIIDGLRQWLVLGRQTQDWGSCVYTAETVNAILNSGSDWTDAASVALPDISIGGKTLNLPPVASMTGAFTLSLDARKASGKKLSVKRSSASPAWGGVISQYVAPILEVKAADVPDMSIRKEIVALVQGDGGQLVPKEGAVLTPGMKVRVTLTISVGRDMDYVAVSDERSACLEPVDQLSGFRTSDGLGFYREVRDETTNLFFSNLSKGSHVISYDCNVSQTGEFSCGIATVQSQYAPSVVAHSAGSTITVE